MIIFLLTYHLFVECRVVGGLLSAYDLSQDKVFLEKAQDIAGRLLPAWDSPSGIPYNIINLARGNPRNPGWTGVSLKVLTDLARISNCLWYAFAVFISVSLRCLHVLTPISSMPWYSIDHSCLLTEGFHAVLRHNNFFLSRFMLYMHIPQ